MNDSKGKVSEALRDAKEVERIMIYIFQNSYKLQPDLGIMLSNRLLQLSGQIVDSLTEAINGGIASEA